MLKGFQDVLPTTPRLTRGAITYAAGSTGAIGSTTLFTVTGDVALVGLHAKCTTDLTSAGAPTFTIAAGAGGASVVDFTFTDVTGWDAGEWAANDGLSAYKAGTTSSGAQLISGYVPVSADIVQTIASATITAGVVRWYVQWVPLSGNGNLALHANLTAF